MAISAGKEQRIQLLSVDALAQGILSCLPQKQETAPPKVSLNPLSFDPEPKPYALAANPKCKPRHLADWDPKSSSKKILERRGQKKSGPGSLAPTRGVSSELGPLPLRTEGARGGGGGRRGEFCNYCRGLKK